jgi:hypothetical protein
VNKKQATEYQPILVDDNALREVLAKAAAIQAPGELNYSEAVAYVVIESLYNYISEYGITPQFVVAVGGSRE